LLSFLVNEIKRLSNDDEEIALQTSSLYRLYYSSLVYKNKSILEKHSNDLTYPQGILLNFLHSIIRDEQQLVEHRVVWTDNMFKRYMEINKVNISEVLKLGIIVEEDFKNAKLFINDFDYLNNIINKGSNAAYIRGTEFRARGIKYCDKYINKSKELNVDNFSRTLSYSSWCKYSNKRWVTDDNLHQNYGQINYFAVVNLPFDNIVHGIPIASISARKHYRALNLGKKCNLDRIVIQEANQPDTFTAVYNILSVPIATVPFSQNNKPINYNSRQRIKDNLQDVHYILLFSLDRHRENIHTNYNIYSLIHPYYEKNALQQFKKEFDSK
jgi:hypothetical protein